MRGTAGPPTRTKTFSDDQNLEKPETGPDAFQKLRDSRLAAGGWGGERQQHTMEIVSALLRVPAIGVRRDRNCPV